VRINYVVIKHKSGMTTRQINSELCENSVKTQKIVSDNNHYVN
jgi:hypothetical protein